MTSPGPNRCSGERPIPLLRLPVRNETRQRYLRRPRLNAKKFEGIRNLMRLVDGEMDRVAKERPERPE